MNYITRLQHEVAASQAACEAMRAAVQELRDHLDTAKFKGVDPDGGRRDWIGVGDVWRWTQRILDAETVT